MSTRLPGVSVVLCTVTLTMLLTMVIDVDRAADGVEHNIVVGNTSLWLFAFY